jgi:glycosyltransferase involved in cell wall biosynthesis
MSNQLALSVVLATYRRAEILRETLQHLAEQDLDPATYEVIVVDDGSPDHTREVVEQWQAKVPFQLIYLQHSNHGPGYTQNRGIEAARAPLVLLMADDIFMLPQALKTHLAMHTAHPEPEVAVLGRVDESRRLVDTVFLRHWDHFKMIALAGRKELPYYWFWACNLSVKREFLMRHALFREQRGRGGEAAHEDIVLGYRLSRFGLRILFSEEARALHCHPTTFEAACNRRYMQGVNFGEFHSHAPAPEIPVVYHVLNWRTLPDHVRAVFGARRRYLEGADRNPVLLLLRHAARAVLFNGAMVRGVWEPLVRAAEHNSTIARLMNAQLYRGVMFYHFLRGCRDGYRKFDRPRRSVGRAQPSSH